MRALRLAIAHDRWPGWPSDGLKNCTRPCKPFQVPAKSDLATAWAKAGLSAALFWSKRLTVVIPKLWFETCEGPQHERSRAMITLSSTISRSQMKNSMHTEPLLRSRRKKVSSTKVFSCSAHAKALGSNATTGRHCCTKRRTFASTTWCLAIKLRAAQVQVIAGSSAFSSSPAFEWLIS